MNNMGFSIARTREELIEFIKLEKGVIWDSSQKLYDVLDDLRDVSNNAKFKAAICKNVHFSGSVEYKGREYRQILDMAEFLHDIKDDDDIVFLNNNIKEALEFIQQCINIDKHPNVYLKEDLYKKKVLENIDKSYSELIDNSKGLIEFISNLKIKPEYRKYFDQIKDTITNIVDELKKLETKVIKVAVFASKKSGKSMVVNGLLGEEYAPTSLELPTPNVVKYVPAEGINKITVEYCGNSYEFEHIEDVREWILSEYNKVKISGNRLKDMVVKYPPKEGINYLIYDTPGPDLAGSEHDIVDEILPDVDVAIFIIDYSKYSQKDEVELFSKLKQYFEERNKKHSLICLINKIDLMFIDAKTEKLRVRVTDFIYQKLKVLEFEEFIVIPISAMTYFYLKKLRDRFGNELVDANDIKRYLEDKEYDVDDEYTRTLMTNIQNVANSIRSTYRKREVGYQDVLHFSNFESFEKYLLNITQRKAKLEKGWSIVRNIEKSVNELANAIRNNEHLVSSEADRIRDELNNFLQKYRDLYLQSALEELNVVLKRAKRDIICTIRDILKDLKKELFRNFREGSEGKIFEISKELKEGVSSLTRKWISKETFIRRWSSVSVDFSEELARAIGAFDENLERSLEETLEKEIKETKRTVDERFSDIQHKLENIVEELNKSLNEIVKQDLSTYKEYFTTPQIQLEFDKESFKESLIESTRELSKMVGKVKVHVSSQVFDKSIQGGFFRWLFSFFGGDRYEVDIDTLDRNIIEPIKNGLGEELSKFSNALNDEFEKAKEELEDKVGDLLSSERRKVEDYLASVENSVGRIKEMLEKEEHERKEIYDLLSEIKLNKHYLDTVSTWYEVYKPYLEYYKQIKAAKTKEAE